MFVVVDIAYLVAAICYMPVLCWQMVRQKKNRTGWGEKLGFIHQRPGPRRIWIHAVSLGEVNATRQLVAGLQKRFADHEIVVSTTTDTGFARACHLYGRARVFRYPLDFSWVIRRVLRLVQPELIVLMELEVWYNLIHAADARGIPVAIANGRLTARSAKRFRYCGAFVRSMFRRLRWVGAQEDGIAQRFGALGTPQAAIDVVGSVKWDTAEVGDDVPGSGGLSMALGIDPERPIWVCGSTGPGEEAIILDAYDRMREHADRPQLVIVPRKPERFDEVAGLIAARGYECVRRRDHADGGGRPVAESVKSPVVLGDTMGELRKFYALATTVFVGRSLVPMGGSDPMEVAALGKPIITGPHMDNFADPSAKLKKADALVEITTAAALADTVLDHCGSPESSHRQGLAGQQVVRDNQGATERTLAALSTFIKPA